MNDSLGSKGTALVTVITIGLSLSAGAITAPPPAAISIKPLTGRSWEVSLSERLSDKYSFLSAPASKDFEKIEILHNFAEKLLSGSEDLDPSIMKLVNENFWDLI